MFPFDDVIMIAIYNTNKNPTSILVNLSLKRSWIGYVKSEFIYTLNVKTQIARFTEPTSGPPGSYRVGPILAL